MIPAISLPAPFKVSSTLTAGAVDAACKESQQVSYRKARCNISEKAGQELISTTTVWNKKQEQGKALKEKQKAQVDKIIASHEPILVKHHIIPPTICPADAISELPEYTAEQEAEIMVAFTGWCVELCVNLGSLGKRSFRLPVSR